MVLLIDLAAALGVSTWGILYLKTDLKYLLAIAAISFGLAFLIWMLLRAGPKPKGQSKNADSNYPSGTGWIASAGLHFLHGTAPNSLLASIRLPLQ